MKVHLHGLGHPMKQKHGVKEIELASIVKQVSQVVRW